MGGIAMEVPMDRLPRQVPGVIMKIKCRKALTQRLRDFGMVPGTVVTIRYRSPDGGVTAFECRGSVLALRTDDLKGVRVKWG